MQAPAGPGLPPLRPHLRRRAMPRPPAGQRSCCVPTGSARAKGGAEPFTQAAGWRTCGVRRPNSLASRNDAGG